MSSHRPDIGKQAWPTSPTFRPGPKNTNHDNSAEEIIRFVRHFQRPDIKQLGASGVKQKAVLPAIGGFYGCIDGSNPNNNNSTCLDNFDSELDVLENQTIETTLDNIGSHDVNILEIGSDDPERIKGSNNNSLKCLYSNNNEVTLKAKPSQETLDNSFIFTTQKNFNDFAESKSIIRVEQLCTSTAKKPCNIYGKKHSCK